MSRFRESLMPLRAAAGHLSTSRPGSEQVDTLLLLTLSLLDLDSSCTCRKRTRKLPSSSLVSREFEFGRRLITGIRAPRTARNANEKAEPFGSESAKLASRYMQRDVEIGE